MEPPLSKWGQNRERNAFCLTATFNHTLAVRGSVSWGVEAEGIPRSGRVSVVPLVCRRNISLNPRRRCGTCVPRVNDAARQSADTIAVLCPACTLCCNGVLFVDVRLQPADDAERLAELGVKLKRRADNLRFQQPCSCLEGKLCRIYAERPTRCRTFECRLLQGVEKGEVTERAALNSIRDAKGRAEKVRRILRELGDADESAPLSRRYQRMMRKPIDLSANERDIELRGELMLAVSDLVHVLERDFLL